MSDVQPLIRGSSAARSWPLHSSISRRKVSFGFGPCAAAGGPSNSKIRMTVTPPMVFSPLTSMSGFQFRKGAVADFSPVDNACPDLAACVPRTGWAQAIILSASTDVEVKLVISLLFGLLRSGRPRLFRNFTLALFNEGGKFDGPIIRNFDARRGASNSHGRDRSIDFHIAGFCVVAGDKSERYCGEIEQGRVGCPIRFVHDLAQSHAGVAGQIERGAIGKIDAEPTIGPGLHHIALIDEIADLRLTGLPREIYLDDRRIHPFNCDRARGGDDLSNGLWCEI